MSIKIQSKKCTGCGKCVDVCPGMLIYMGKEGKAFIKYPDQCWGCAACVKECMFGAIKYYIGADIGGRGTCFYTKNFGEYVDFIFVKNGKEETIIRVNKKEANKY